MKTYVLKTLRQSELQREEEQVLKKLAHLEKERLNLQAELRRIMDEKFALRSEG
jgi:hypothetical protein